MTLTVTVPVVAHQPNKVEEWLSLVTTSLEMAKRGEVEIIVSAIATIEVACLQGSDGQESEAKIQELFSREHIIPAAIDIGAARIARGLVRKYWAGPKIKPPDSAHLATAIRLQIPVVEAAYFRSDLLSERRPLMTGWADYLDPLPF